VDNNSEKHYAQKIFKWLKKNRIVKLEIKNKNIEENLFNLKKICFYKKNKINYGCGLGHNFGYKFCLRNGFKYIARIDNDMIVPNLTIFNLVNRMKKNQFINALSPKIMFVNRPSMIWYSGTKIGNNLKMQKACSIDSPKGHKDNKSYKGLVNTDAIAGCASIMKASKLSSSGLSDPEFFYGEEDTELSFRLIDSPESLKIDLNQKIYHHISATVGENWGKNIYYNYKYRLLLVKKIGTFFDKFF
jgi:GT2 family glycosyltransferase